MKYDFECPEHGVFEINQSMKETTPTHPCPECGQECKKVIMVVPIHFRGGDWASKKPKVIDPKDRDWVKRRQKEKQF